MARRDKIESALHFGAGRVAIWDQRKAEIRDRLRDAEGFVFFGAYNPETKRIETTAMFDIEGPHAKRRIIDALEVMRDATNLAIKQAKKEL